MTWIWNSLRLPRLGRFWRCRRQRRVPMLDPRLTERPLAPRSGVRQLIARTGHGRRPAAHAPWLVAALDQILVWIERSKQRAQFAELGSHLAARPRTIARPTSIECRKHFWQR